MICRSPFPDVDIPDDVPLTDFILRGAAEHGDKPAQLLEHSFDNTELDANAAVYGSRVQQIQVFVADEDNAIHVLTLSEAAEIFITKRPIFDQIISSFRVQ